MTAKRAVALQRRRKAGAGAKPEKAYRTSRKALRLRERDCGGSSPELADLLNDLAEIELERQKFAEALAFAERAQSIERASGTTVRTRMKTLALAGAIRRIQGDYAHAQRDLQQALAISVAEFGGRSEETAEAQNNLAVLYKYWGRFPEGLKLYRQALKSMIAIHGEQSLPSATVYHNLGGILHARGDFAEAEKPARKAWEISRNLLGENDARTMLDATAYAGVLDGLKRYDESEPIYRRALARFERLYGPRHYEVAATLHNLAAVLVERGRHREAERFYRRALAIQRRLLGNDSPDVALTAQQSWEVAGHARSPGGSDRASPRGGGNSPGSARTWASQSPQSP